MHDTVVDVPDLVFSVAGLAFIAVGITTLFRRESVFARLRGTVTWRAQGWAYIAVGGAVLVQSLANLAGASRGVMDLTRYISYGFMAMFFGLLFFARSRP